QDPVQPGRPGTPAAQLLGRTRSIDLDPRTRSGSHPRRPGRTRMIGVVPKPTEIRVAQEFFQLFKTPWELYVPGRHYDVVLSTSDDVPRDPGAKVVLVYNSKIIPFDHDRKL